MSGPLRVRVRRHGAVDLRDEAACVADAVDALGLDPSDPLATATSDPPSLSRALAAAARERGHDHPADDRIATLRRRLDAGDSTQASVRAAAASLSTARRRAATAGADVDRLRERVATLRGRRDATEHGFDGGDDAGRDVEEAFTAATRALTEAETERVAATQALAHATERVRETRDARERRLRLRDEVANRRREARRDLSRAVSAAFTDALAGIPGSSSPADTGASPGAFAGDPAVAHLAAIRVARRDDPVVVAVPTFDHATAAAESLRAPVVLVAPE